LNLEEPAHRAAFVPGIPRRRHCRFGRPARIATCGPPSIAAQPNSDATVRLLDNRSERALKNWRKAATRQPKQRIRQHSLEAMSPAERKPIEEFFEPE